MADGWLVHNLVIGLVGFFMLGLFMVNPAKAEKLTEDGLHTQDWFIQDSFLELADDAQNAIDGGKRLVVMWELKGCPYCAETHRVNFQDERIVAYMKQHFDVLQLNYIGSKRVTDFQGEELSEKEMGKRYAVRYTPTIQFFPDDITGLEDIKAMDREIFRISGYVKPDHFYAMLTYVAEGHYKEMSIGEFFKQNPIN